MIGLNEQFGELVNVQVERSHCLISFKQCLTILSNAPWLGGYQNDVKGILNLNVPKNAPQHDRNTATFTDSVNSKEQYSIERSFAQQFKELELNIDHIGLMTAASMDSFRSSYTQVGPYELLCCVTSGLANARRVGDPADFDEFNSAELKIPCGTINIMVVSNLPLTPTAQTEALLLITEAKTAVCYDNNVLSRSSSLIATGTGTDVSLIASAQHNETQNTFDFCGKHTRIGEEIGKGVYYAVSKSIQACIDKEIEERKNNYNND
ncbi:MAG: adenosylcobinamide amidohydrolase [Pseudomonadales bacterium]|nr:adenosylcobinamide amidohydrolase [Pseudomonadales bacterium]